MSASDKKLLEISLLPPPPKRRSLTKTPPGAAAEAEPDSTARSSEQAKQESDVVPGELEPSEKTEAITVPQEKWFAQALHDHPDIVEIYSRLAGVVDLFDLSRLYFRSQTESKESNSRNVVLNLIGDYLYKNGFRSSFHSLLREGNFPFTLFYDSESIYKTKLEQILNISIKGNVDKIWEDDPEDVTGNPYAIRSKQKSKFKSARSEADMNINAISLPEKEHEVEIPEESPNAFDFTSESLTKEKYLEMFDEDTGDVIYFGDPIGSDAPAQRRPSKTLPNSKKRVLYFTFNYWISLLTSDSYFETTFQDAFLFLYKMHASPERVLKLLILRYFIPDGCYDEKKVKVIQTKVVNAIKNWVDKKFEDFNEKLVQALLDFLDNMMMQKMFSELAKSIKLNISKKMGMDDKSTPRRHVESRHANESYEEVIVPMDKIFSPDLKMDMINETELARQITLIQFDIFRRLRIDEFVDLGSGGGQEHSKNLIRMITFSERITNWVYNSIIEVAEKKDRGKTITRYLKIMENLLKLKNYDGVMAVYNAFQKKDVKALFVVGLDNKHIEMLETCSKLFKRVEKGMVYTYGELDHPKKLVKTDENIKRKRISGTAEQMGVIQVTESEDSPAWMSEINYYFATYPYLREEIDNNTSPLIPAVEVYIDDINEVKKNFKSIKRIDGKDYINYHKIRLYAKVFEVLKDFQAAGYTRLQPVYQIKKLILKTFDFQKF